MAKDFPGGWFENTWLTSGLVKVNSTTGALESGGVPITGTIPVTIAQFLVLDPADYIGAELLIEDIPVAHSLYNGVAVRANAAGTGWIWMQTPSFTRAAVPTAAQASGWRIFVSDLSNRGSYWYSDGTEYKLDQPSVVISNITSNIVLTGTPTGAAVAKQVTIPLIDGKSIWRNGDILQIEQNVEKTGVADIMHGAVYIGQTTRVLDDNETAANTLISTLSGNVNTNDGFNFVRKFVRKSATSIRNTGPELAHVGGISSIPSVDVTIPSLDTATSYVDATIRIATSTGDTDLTLNAHTVTLIQAGAA